LVLLDQLLGNPLILAAIVSAILSAIVSILVAWFFGERAAVNLTIKEERRNKHHLSLVSEPLDSLIAELESYEQSVAISLYAVDVILSHEACRSWKEYFVELVYEAVEWSSIRPWAGPAEVAMVPEVGTVSATDLSVAKCSE